MQTCRQIAMGNGTPYSETMPQSLSPGYDVVEYHNGIHFITILGELVAPDDRIRTRRLTRILINDATVASEEDGEQSRPENLKRELAGLEVTDVQYLFKKGVFNLPPQDCWYASINLFHCSHNLPLQYLFIVDVGMLSHYTVRNSSTITSFPYTRSTPSLTASSSCNHTNRVNTRLS
jgi:hypothetical protein